MDVNKQPTEGLQSQDRFELVTPEEYAQRFGSQQQSGLIQPQQQPMANQQQDRFGLVTPEEYAQQYQAEPRLKRNETMEQWQQLPMEEKKQRQEQPAFYYKQSEEPGWLEKGVQVGTQAGSRALEHFLGFAGDTIQLGSSLLNFGITATTGNPIEMLSNLPIPTSENIRKYGTEPLANLVGYQGAISEKDPINQFADFVGDLTGSFMSPTGAIFPAAAKAAGIGGKALKAAEFIGSKPMETAKALKTAGIGGLAKFGAQQLKLPDWAGDTLSVGAMLGYNLLGPKAATAMKEALYGKEASIIKNNPITPINNAEEMYTALEDARNKGIITREWNETIEGIGRAANTGTIPIKTVREVDKGLNFLYKSKSGNPFFDKFYDPVKKMIQDTYKLYDKEVAPGFYNILTDANDLHGALSKSQSIIAKAEKMIDPAVIGAGTAGLLFGIFNPLTLAKGVGVYGILKGVASAKILQKSKVARNLFYKTMQAVTRGKIENANKYAKELSGIIDK